MLFLSISEAQTIGQYLSYGVSVATILSFFLIVRNGLRKPIKELQVKMDAKVDKTQYLKDQTDHNMVHEIDRDNMKHIRSRVDDIYEHLLNAKNE